jgi:imidazolonepropionase-like amidohydrolase
VLDSLRRLGVDLVKLHNGVPHDPALELLRQAARRGMRTAVHPPVTVTARELTEAGARSVEHAAVLFDLIALRPENRGKPVRDLIRAAYFGDSGAALWREYAANETFVDPTLIVFDVTNGYLQGKAYTDPSYARYVSAAQEAHWLRTNPPPQIPAEQIPRIVRSFDELTVPVVGEMRRGGVSLLAGTDVGVRGVVPGFSLHDELALLVRAGLSPMQALQAATRNAAAWFGSLDTLGTVQPGRVADLIILDADPLSDIRNTKRISAVVAAGRYFGRRALDSLLASARRR